MTKEEAIEHATLVIPDILPLDKTSIIQLCEQTLKQCHNDLNLISESFLGILGDDDISLEFISKFNELISSDFSEDIDNNMKSELKLKLPSLDFAPKSVKETQKNKISKKIKSLQEIDDVLKILDLTSDNSQNPKSLLCDCQGNIHPLFEVVPNCLSCGKIICIKEGINFNDCSYCNEELIPINERLKLIELLNFEKQKLLSKDSRSKTKPIVKPKTYKISSGAGVNLFNEQDRLFDKVEKDRLSVLEKESQEVLENISKKPTNESDSELQLAYERLETLLHFQDTSTERMKIIDNASDFSMDNNIGIWGSVYEKALMLKKQQRNLRRWEKLEKEKNGKREKIMLELNIDKDGNAFMTEVIKPHISTTANSDDEFSDISDKEDLAYLKDIKSLKEEIASKKAYDCMSLTNKIWDYEKDKQQFKQPVYVGKNSDNNNQQQLQSSTKWGRVQNVKNQDDSLEENILSIL